MSTEPFIGEVKLLAFNYPPQGFQLCQGQTISISAYTALFALIGTTYGGDGQTTFKLPDLQGRVPVHQGQGAGLPSVMMGQNGGAYQTTIVTANMPMHIHTLGATTAVFNANDNGGGENSPDGGYFGINNSQAFYASSPAANEFMNSAMVRVSGTTGVQGGSVPVDITNPYLCINYSIAMQGIFPSRN